MPAFTKTQRRRLRELVDLAYRRELEGELGALEAEFGRWRSGEIDAFDLNERVHRYHNGAARDLWKLYANLTNRWLDMRVASALASGVLSEEDVGEDIAEALAERVAFLREQRRREG